MNNVLLSCYWEFQAEQRLRKVILDQCKILNELDELYQGEVKKMKNQETSDYSGSGDKN